MNVTYWDHLIDGHLDDTLSNAERAEFEALMLESAAARRRFWELAEVHGLAREAVRLAYGDEPNAATGPASAELPSRPKRHPRGLNWVWRRPLVAATSASLFLAAILTAVFLRQASASPTAVLRSVLKVQAATLDRCYRIEVRLDPVVQQSSRLPTKFESRLWTRGDRFWIENRTGDRTIAWGRDTRGGNVWIALSPEIGVRLAADEVGERLALHCELRTLQIESLLHSVLADFDLRREAGGAEDIELIHATLKAGRVHPLYRAALLEVDTKSGALRRVVLDRVHRGRQVATVSFTLAEISLQPESSYTLAGHLTPQAKVYDRQHEPGQRGALLAQFFGAIWSSDAGR